MTKVNVPLKSKENVEQIVVSFSEVSPQKVKIFAGLLENKSKKTEVKERMAVMHPKKRKLRPNMTEAKKEWALKKTMLLLWRIVGGSFIVFATGVKLRETLLLNLVEQERKDARCFPHRDVEKFEEIKWMCGAVFEWSTNVKLWLFTSLSVCRPLHRRLSVCKSLF